ECVFTRETNLNDPRIQCESLKYYHSRFSSIQAIIDSAIIKFVYKANGSILPNYRIGLFPQQIWYSQNQNNMDMIISIISMGFLPCFTVVPIQLVMEREKKTKNAMIMMGMNNLAYWFACFIVQLLISSMPCLIITIVFTLHDLTIYLNPIYFYILLQSYAITLILLGFLISSPFTNLRVVSILSTMFGFSIPWAYLVSQRIGISYRTKRILSIFSPLAFAYTLEYSMFHRSNDQLLSYQTYSFLFGETMLIVDAFLYYWLTFFFDYIVINRHSIWNRYFRFKRTSPIHQDCDEEENGLEDRNVDIEKISDSERSCRNLIEIKNVYKIFDKKTVAISNLSLEIYESQITAIIGQNGAGKTSLLNMLNGSMQPTSGQIKIFNLDISEVRHLRKLQTRFGVCFQEDILIDELTTMEQLIFFGQMKGCFGRELRKEIKFLLTETDLTEKKNSFASSLSGGQRRKLCIAVALIGGSKILFFDEPTSGVDPYSRRKIWKLLNSYKENRFIILSTHFMDEADILADRKVILVRGRIRCVGSSLFLKNRLGVGYHLRLEIDPNIANVEDVEYLIKQFIERPKLNRQTTSELLFTLPKDETKSFANLFRRIDDEIGQEKLGILSYGIKLTTLEDVFLRICYESEKLERTSPMTNTENVIAKKSTDFTPKSQQSSSDQMKQKTESNLAENVIDFNDLESIVFKPSDSVILWEFFRIRILLILRNWPHLLSLSIQSLSMVAIIFVSGSQPSKPKSITISPFVYSNQDRIILFANHLNRTSSNNRSTISKEIQSLSRYFQPIQVDRLNLETMRNRHFALQFTPIDSVGKLSSSSLHRSTSSIIGYELTMMINKTFHQALPILQNIITNMLIESGKITNNSKRSPLNIRIRNLPLPDRLRMGEITFMFMFIMILSTNLVTFPINLALETLIDRNENIKNNLILNGMKSLHYWLGTLLVHSFLFLIFFAINFWLIYMLVWLPFFQLIESAICLIILIILYIPTSILVCYIVAQFFRRTDTAHSFLSTICSMITFIVFALAFLVQIMFEESILSQFFYFIWPFYIPYGCILNIITTEQRIAKNSIIPYRKSSYSFLSEMEEISFFTWRSNIVPAFVALLFHFGLCIYLLRFVDKIKSQNDTLFRVMWKKLIPTDIETISVQELKVESKETDVLAEQKRIEMNLQFQNRYTQWPLMIIRNLFKKYGSNTVVKRLNLIIENGQIFGLLGPNGAGKTTVLKIISSEEKKTCGQILFEGQPLQDSMLPKLLSYCPQNNPFWLKSTFMENMRLYAAIHGIPRERIQPICLKFAKYLGADPHKNKRFHKLSGGNKRKLSLLVSILSDTRLTLLDEPSTGMDPNSKRALWNTIIKKFDPKGSKSSIMTSHSMEEVEALCTRLGIMSKGSLECLGNIQHLNTKYGKGYLLEIKIKADGDVTKIKNRIKNLFPSIQFNDDQKNRLVVNVPQDEVKSLANFFETMESMIQENIGVEEYGLTQSSIEQVFIEFAKLAEDVPAQAANRTTPNAQSDQAPKLKKRRFFGFF
ncbi:ABC transporter-like protein 14, partial [Sarcoptes scabiei]